MSRPRDHHTALAVAFGAACNAALTVVLVEWAAGDGVPPWPDLPRGLALLSAVGAAIGLVAYGAAMNNLLDRRRDAAISGTRPSASTGPDALVLVGSLVVAIAMATALGRDATWVTLVLAMLLLFHNGVAKFIPAIGLVVPGSLVAGIMLVPDWQMPMPTVVWLAMSIVVLTSIGVHILADKRPILSGRALVVVVFAWFVLSGVILTLRGMGANASWLAGHSPVVLLWPLGGLLLLGLTMRGVLPRSSTRRIAARRAIRLVALWQPLLAASWCMAVDAIVAAIVFAGLWAVGILLAGGSRELAAISGEPPTWR
ncbi:MAG: hypothetical protein P8I91_06225 [Phycisphaerales bacterium]|nr:hypothetical protein [Phycisphaerales bacterium]